MFSLLRLNDITLLFTLKPNIIVVLGNVANQQAGLLYGINGLTEFFASM